VSYAILEPRASATLDDYVAHIAWAPDTARLAVGGGEGKVSLLRFGAGGALDAATLGEHMMGVLGVSWRPRSNEFATTGQDGVAIWSADSAAEFKRWRAAPQATEHVTYSPDGALLATAAGKKVSLWTPTGDLVHAFAPAASTVAALTFDKPGRDLAAAINGGVQLHRIEKNTYTTRQLPWEAAALTASFSPNGKVIACGMSDGAVHFWYLATRKDSQMRGYGGRVTLTAFSANSRYLATTAGPDLVLWDFGGKGPEGSRPLQLSGHTDRVECFDWQPNGPYLASGGRDWRISLWWPGKTTQAVDAHLADADVTVLRWSPDSRWLAVGEKTGRLTVYELVQP
jgi:WD40 repeat protein